MIELLQNIQYNKYCCGMIAVKQEVAALHKSWAGFLRSECQVWETGDKSLYNIKSA